MRVLEKRIAKAGIINVNRPPRSSLGAYCYLTPFPKLTIRIDKAIKINDKSKEKDRPTTN